MGNRNGVFVNQLRLDIQGLRALAVAGVVLFHFFPAQLTGGYVGVDVFFVISGFLITAHIVREIEKTGRLSLSQFWARRVRRLLPAAFLVLIASAIAVIVWFPKSAVIQNLSEIGFAGFYSLNWRLAADSVDYLAQNNAASMAQHYWSLSVEEQFYVAWPLLITAGLWATAKLKGLSTRQVLTALLTVVLVISLTYSVYATVESPASAYFATTTRAWEFAIGGLVALTPPSKLHGWFHALVSWCALGGLGCAMVFFTGETPFPGYLALLPVLATATLIWVGDSESTWGPQYLSRSGPVQLVGDTSYAIYLWHWPLIVFFTVMMGRAPGWKWSLLLGALTVVLAIATKYLVEDPVRNSRGVFRTRKFAFIFMAVGLAATLLVTVVPIQITNYRIEQTRQQREALVADVEGCFGGYYILNNCSEAQPAPDVYASQYAAQDFFRSTGAPVTSDCEIDGNETVCRFPTSSPESLKVILIGDSHAEHMLAPISQIAEANNWSLTSKTRSGCTTFASASTDPRCVVWGSEVHRDIANDESLNLVIVSIRQMHQTNPSAYNLVDDRLSELRSLGKEVVVMRTVPGTENDWPISRKSVTGPQCAERSSAQPECNWNPPSDPDWLMEAAKRQGVPVVDTWKAVCLPDGCPAILGGAVVYFDDNHLTTTFARTLAPWLENQLELVRRQSAQSF